MANYIKTKLDGRIVASTDTSLLDKSIFSLISDKSAERVLDITQRPQPTVKLIYTSLFNLKNSSTLLFKLDEELHFMEFDAKELEVVEKLYEITSIQATEIRHLTKKVRDTSLFEEVTKLNNQLANTQRELAKNNQKLKQLSYTDTLTQLGNRRLFFEHIRSRNEDSLVTSIDIDNFKSINDTLGHAEGDEALILFAKLLKQYLDSSKTMHFRMGGDEFCVISCVEDKLLITENLEKISNALGSKYENVALSYGFTKVPANFQRSELDKLLVSADIEMYTRKSKKKTPKK